VTYLAFACKRRTCPVCGPRRARLLARTLVLDAAIRPPGWCMTLTTADPETASETFRGGMAYVGKRLRRWWEVEYFAKVEFTTGRGRKAGGQRRMHAHALLKGLEGADLLNVEEVVRSAWRASTGAYVVEVAELRVPSAALHYLGLHHSKASQLPPASWRGMAERASRGYWSKPVAELREEAKRQLWAESLTWATGLDAADARLLVDGQCAQREAQRVERRAEVEALWEWRFAEAAAATERAIAADTGRQLALSFPRG